VDNCPAGKVPKLSEDNQKTWFLIEKMLPGMFKNRSLDYEAVKYVLTLWRVSDGQAPIVFDRCRALYDGILSITNEQQDNN
jgi:hypothetical protein